MLLLSNYDLTISSRFALRQHPYIDVDGHTYLFSRPSAESLKNTLPVAYLPRGVTLFLMCQYQRFPCLAKGCS